MSRLATLLAAGTALAAVSSLPVHAGQHENPAPTPPAVETPVANPATANAWSRSFSQGGNATGGAGGLGGAATATGGAGGSASANGGRASSNVTNNITTGSGSGGSAGSGNSGGGVNGVGTLTVRNVPNMALALATAYCGNSLGGAGAGAGWGLSLTITRHDRDCVRQNYSLILIQMGEKDAALALMMENDEVRKAVERAHGTAVASAPALSSQQLTSAIETVPASRLNTATRVPAYCEPRRGESTADRLMRTRNAC